MPRAESQLLRYAIDGDEDAIVSLLDQHAADLRRRLGPRIPKRHQAVISIDDVMQQTFVDACREIKRFEPRESHSFQAWLGRIAERNLLDALRMLEAAKRGGSRLRAGGRTREDSCRGLVELLGASQEGPSTIAANRETLERLESALLSLPADYRSAIELHDLQERSMEDVADQLGRSVGAAYMLRARAHRLLGEMLGGTSGLSPTSRE